MLILLVLSILVVAISGAPALVSRDTTRTVRGRSGEVASTALALFGAAGGLFAAFSTLAYGRSADAAARWQLPNAAVALHLDPLAAAFLLPIFVLGALASVYGLEYWPARHQQSASRVRVFTGLLLAGMATVVLAAHAVLFLVAWETMAIAAFFLIATEDRDAEVRGAAWLYLIATHIGTLALFALFAVLRAERGTFVLGPVAAAAGAVIPSVILLLALAGFGFKAGVVPLHFWLPGAHALFAPILARAVAGAAPGLAAPVALPALLQPIQTSALIVAGVVVLAVLLLLAATRRAAKAPTWDCGYAAPTARMQYTASSLARGLVGFFAWAMPPVVHTPRPFPLFPSSAAFESHVPDTVLDRALLPALRGARWALGFARFIQHGRMQLYLVYLGVTLVVLLAWSAR